MEASKSVKIMVKTNIKLLDSSGLIILTTHSLLRIILSKEIEEQRISIKIDSVVRLGDDSGNFFSSVL